MHGFFPAPILGSFRAALLYQEIRISVKKNGPGPLLRLLDVRLKGRGKISG
jgi:hypothetical protein